MRLKHIKLAGFKSFVDPTKVPFEQQMTAIVGPNGCGKSNIIDAVRWVLGESSAKNLRGDSMTDVIFNGAETRKSVGIASVELVFDNIDGRIAGHLADRNQISIRRSVNRESINSYFLNGTKCRRRDITDIFLGTGLGPRSYAIIEQGTISRLIESKPQELRIFIEEAAGISKYKERRRDTENRIRHTRENLERLNDIRFELGIQIDKLHQQSEAAKRFRQLKAQERTFKAELAVLRWQNFNQQQQSIREKLTDNQQKITQLTLLQKSYVIELDSAKQKASLDNEKLQALQHEKIQLTNDIARTEQSIKHQKQQLVQVDKDNNFAQQQLDKSHEQLAVENKRVSDISIAIDSYLPKQDHNQQLLNLSKDTLAQITKKQQLISEQWQASLERQSEAKQQVSHAKSEMSAQTALVERIKVTCQEYGDIVQQLKLQSFDEIETLEKELTLVKQQSDAITNSLRDREPHIANMQAALMADKETLAQQKGALSALKSTYQQLSKQQDSHEGWQLTQDNWLKEQGVSEVPIALISQIDIMPGWEKALEVVLAPWLQASVVSQLPSQIALEKACLLAAGSRGDAKASQSILSKIVSMPVSLAYLEDIYTADSMQEAKQLLTNLPEHASVVCPDGTWLGKNFIRRGDELAAGGYLQRKRELSLLLAREKSSEKDLQALAQQIENQEKALADLQEQVVDLTNNQEQSLELYRSKHQTLLLKKQAQQQHAEQVQARQGELTKSQQLLETEQGKLNALIIAFDKLPQVNEADDALASLSQEKVTLSDELTAEQGRSNDLHNERHQLALTIEQLKNEKAQREQGISRLKESVNQFRQQLQRNKQITDNNTSPLQADEVRLQQWLSAMVTVNEQMHAHQSAIVSQQNLIADIEQSQLKTSQQLAELKELAGKQHIDSESFRLRAETALEVLAEMQKSVSEVKSTMPDNAKEGIWQANIARIVKDISVLGAINLAAIEEYESQLARKNHLDNQNDDLILAINTLESAIEKIDQETRQKFIKTFEQVNSDLQKLFPKVFGGGNAYLALTGDDMLEAGVTIMARPPGKKNSTIHLLSGGEKALTALSLVFAIFRLNPAPFCMLDEVDAPLDDANVSRFCNLVKEMSQTVQFIYISHNKIAMEMASHLTGVTMFEAGVSKMVAVDIDEAVAMAEIT